MRLTVDRAALYLCRIRCEHKENINERNGKLTIRPAAFSDSISVVRSLCPFGPEIQTGDSSTDDVLISEDLGGDKMTHNAAVHERIPAKSVT